MTKCFLVTLFAEIKLSRSLLFKATILNDMMEECFFGSFIITLHFKKQQTMHNNN